MGELSTHTLPDDIEHLLIHHRAEFTLWWDPDEFNWMDRTLTELLCKYCVDHFHIWWDPDRFRWSFSYILCEYCSQYFDTWWDPQKVGEPGRTYGFVACCLARYCSDYFHKWWNLERMEWFVGEFCLALYLSEYCSRYIEIWWQPDEIFDYREKVSIYDHERYIETLTFNLLNHCSNYVHIWGIDLLTRVYFRFDEVFELVLKEMSKFV